MAGKLIKFDMVDHLGGDEAIAEYLSQVLADGHTDELIRALGHIAKARGMAKVANATGLGRESLYKALAPGAKPRCDTILKVIRALDIRLRAETACGFAVSPPIASPPCLHSVKPSRTISNASQMQHIGASHENIDIAFVARGLSAAKRGGGRLVRG